MTLRLPVKFLVLFVFFCPALNGCSPAAREKMLRTFVDGVPEPEPEKEAPKAGAATHPGAEEASPRQAEEKKQPAASVQPPPPAAHFHPPFLENQCDSCHDTKTSQKLIAQGKDLCFACHEDFTQGKPVVHYPAGEGLCTECHDPHQSPNPRMLKKAMPELCFSCHDEGEIRGKPAHQGAVSCAACHQIHASDREKLLK
jgi:predicted CXXCH cytochrome family protein